MTVLSPAYAENIGNLIKTQDCVVRLHTAQPASNGAGSEATLADGTILAADWDVYEDSNGGRGYTNAVAISFGDATVVETLAWYSLWEADGLTHILHDPLDVTQDTVIGNPVAFPIGALRIVGRGAA